jgi:hypothetical protein
MFLKTISESKTMDPLKACTCVDLIKENHKYLGVNENNITSFYAKVVDNFSF